MVAAVRWCCAAGPAAQLSLFPTALLIAAARRWRAVTLHHRAALFFDHLDLLASRDRCRSPLLLLLLFHLQSFVIFSIHMHALVMISIRSREPSLALAIACSKTRCACHMHARPLALVVVT
jgi:hypothetical protein